jgi:hypothetical protein
MNFYLPEAATRPKAQEDDSLDGPFWDAAAREELVVQRCVTCGGYQWLPEVICHRCHSWDLAFSRVEPWGAVYSWERIWHPVRPELAGSVPYLAVVVELSSCPNVKMIGNLLGDPGQDVVIGTPVRAVFEHHEAYTLVQWEPAGERGEGT